MPPVPEPSHTSIGPYTIAREIGRGGMGVVYLGRDTRLERDVAIKALPEHLAQDPERLGRFEREAKTLAQLSHPNVAGIHGVEEHHGARYLVLEYVEGETLAARLDRGPLPVDEALEIAVQIAAGVEAAHEAGVIHRDLKPGNVIVTPGGKAKVLDFGLARAEEASSSTRVSSTEPTITSPAIHSPTMPGVILGTAAYMSPEQARGRKVDKRTDIWSFGVILYEMLTGASPFIGETVGDSIGAVLHKEVNLDRLPAATPPIVRHVVNRCLARDKSLRLRDIGDARIELTRAASGDADDAAIAAAPRKPRLTWAVTGVFFVIAAYASWSAWLTPGHTALPVVRSSIMPPEDIILVVTGDLAGPAALSHDGSKMALVAKQGQHEQRLFVRAMDDEEYRSIRGTEGATFPFWSWNDSSVGYFARGELRRYDLTTRTNRVICAAPGGRGGAWLADDRIIFAPGFQTPLSSVPADGGEPITITTIDKDRHTSHRWPGATPDGTRFIYLAVSHESGRLDENAIFLHAAGGPDIEVTRAQFPGQIVSGHLLVLREGTLCASPFDDATGTLLDPAIPIAEGVLGDLTTWYAPLSATTSGSLIFHKLTGDLVDARAAFGAPGGYGEATRTAVLRRDGRPASIIADGIPQSTTSISPDYEFVAISAAPEGASGRTQYDIWLYPLPGYIAPGQDDTQDAVSIEPQLESPRRLTFLEGTELSPQWSPDGEWIVFGSVPRKDKSDRAALLRVRATGGQPETLLEISDADTTSELIPSDWSKDGRYIIYIQGSWVEGQINDLYALDLDTGKTMPLVVTDGSAQEARVSPDGKWLAYESNESGDWEVYVVPFAPGWEQDREQGLPAPAEDARWRVSIAGGRVPRWKPQGGELYYLATSNSLIMVEADTDGPIFRYNPGTALFEAACEAGVQYDVSADGLRFTFNGFLDDRWTSISLITNWPELLRE